MEQSNLMMAIFIVVIAYLCSTFSNLEEFNEIQKIYGVVEDKRKNKERYSLSDKLKTN